MLLKWYLRINSSSLDADRKERLIMNKLNFNSMSYEKNKGEFF